MNSKPTMMIHKKTIILKIHLLISVCIVVPVGLFYAFNPGYFFEIQVNTIDEHNVFKAIMGLYSGFSVLWMLGIFNASFLKPALLTNMIFMLGLAFGRMISIVLDGIPTTGYVFGTFCELFLGLYGLWVLQNKTLILPNKHSST